jgi:hypothetical protein
MINWSEFSIGEHRTACPHCQKKLRDKTLGLTIHADGRGVAHCFRCDFVETTRSVVREYRAIKPVSSAPSPQKHERLSAYGQALWNACKPISGIAEAYLKARHCVIPPLDADLRWHDALKHEPSRYVGAALVALVTHAQTREPLTLHRTWILPTGKKADVEPARMMLGNHSSKGGVIRLWGDDYVSGGLGIAEGIETALSLAHGFTPVWATIDAGHLSKFALIRSVECLTIAVDQDQAGIKAANECAARWASAGRTVYLTRQSTNDLNDLLEAA